MWTLSKELSDLDQRWSKVWRSTASTAALLHQHRGQTFLYLHSYGFSGLLPIENAAGLELWLHGVRLDGGSDRLSLTVDDDVRVGACVTTPKALLQRAPSAPLPDRHICRSGVNSGFFMSTHLPNCPGSAAPQLRARTRASQLAGTQRRNSNIWFLVYPVSAPCWRRDSF